MLRSIASRLHPSVSASLWHTCGAGGGGCGGTIPFHHASNLLGLGASTTSSWSTNVAAIPTASRCATLTSSVAAEGNRVEEAGGVAREDMPFFHHRGNERPHSRPKFKIPRKRASKLFAELNHEAVRLSVESNPDVLSVPFNVGDAIEITQVGSGGVNSTDLETIRGVVLGIRKRGLGTGVYIRDVLLGYPMERKIQLHSPLLKSLRVLEKHFATRRTRRKGKRVRRSKLYYLRDRNPTECRVTKAK